MDSRVSSASARLQFVSTTMVADGGPTNNQQAHLLSVVELPAAEQTSCVCVGVLTSSHPARQLPLELLARARPNPDSMSSSLASKYLAAQKSMLLARAASSAAKS